MKNKITTSPLIITMMLAILSCQQYEFNFEGTTSEFNIYSNIVEDEFKIYTYLPEDYSANNRYPVIFLLDGDWYFNNFTRELNDLIQGNNIEPALIIGIGYQNNIEQKRFRDYTFPQNTEYDITNGEADKFSQFLKSELLPKIATDYASDTTNYVLMGHSLGGLHTLYNMLQANSPFGAYVAISSSVWWSNGFLFGMEEQFFNNTTDLSSKVYIGVGGDEPPSMTILNEELAERLKARNYNSLRLMSEVFSGASHSQVPMTGFSNGIKFVLN